MNPNVMVAICGIIYFITALGFVFKNQWSWALVYISYSLANLGLILSSQNI